MPKLTDERRGGEGEGEGGSVWELMDVRCPFNVSSCSSSFEITIEGGGRGEERRGDSILMSELLPVTIRGKKRELLQ